MILIILYLLSSHATCCVGFTSYLFGDSLVDSGNNDYLFTLSKANTPPYGIDFGPSKGNPTGRFTNGRTVSDIIDDQLGAKSHPPPYLSPGALSNVDRGGFNFASGGSGILDKTGSLFIERVSLRGQVDYFEQCRRDIVNLMGEDESIKFINKAIFSITIGSNDILNYIQPDIPFIGNNINKVSTATLQDLMVSNLTLQLKRLNKLGARKLFIVGVGPLGCIPFVKEFNLVPKGECLAYANELIKGYNAKLIRSLGRLNREFGPKSMFVYANSYDILMGILLEYRHYGFENTSDPCCGRSFPQFICFKGKDEEMRYVVCEDRKKYVFWDSYHPTEAVNAIIATKLLDGNKNLSFPINIRRLYQYSI